MESKIFADEFNQTKPIVNAQNTHVLEWPRMNGEFTFDVFRRLWAYYRASTSYIDGPTSQSNYIQYARYTKYVQSADGSNDIREPELQWYDVCNLRAVFDQFLSNDVNDAPLFLAFCMSSGDEFLLWRVVRPDGRSFLTVKAEYSKSAGHKSRNQLPEQESVDLVCVVTNAAPGTHTPDPRDPVGC